MCLIEMVVFFLISVREGGNEWMYCECIGNDSHLDRFINVI